MSLKTIINQVKTKIGIASPPDIKLPVMVNVITYTGENPPLYRWKDKDCKEYITKNHKKLSKKIAKKYGVKKERLYIVEATLADPNKGDNAQNSKEEETK